VVLAAAAVSTAAALAEEAFMAAARWPFMAAGWAPASEAEVSVQPLSEAVSEAVDFKAEVWRGEVSRATVSAAMASTTTGFTTAADLEWAYLAMDRTPITATTIMINPTTPTTIPITTMATATRCNGACTRAPAGTIVRSRSAADAAFDRRTSIRSGQIKLSSGTAGMIDAALVYFAPRPFLMPARW